jgi:hypothetical protein
VSEINTANDQFVGLQHDRITVLAPKRLMTREEALRHAAWLVTVSGDDERFKEILQAIRNT